MNDVKWKTDYYVNKSYGMPKEVNCSGCIFNKKDCIHPDNIYIEKIKSWKNRNKNCKHYSKIIPEKFKGALSITENKRLEGALSIDE